MFGVQNRPILLFLLLLLGVFFVWQVTGSPVTISITLGEKKQVRAAGEPLTIDAPVTFTSTNNLTVPKVIDAANSAYFLDPAATGDSLVTAGKVTAGSFAGDGSLLTGISGIPAGLVSFFNLASCPTGWTDLTATYGGRYMVAKPTGGTLAGTSGTALTDLESRAVGQHLHSVDPPSTSTSSDGNHSHTFTHLSYSDNSTWWAGGYGSSPYWTGGTTSTAGSHTHTVDIAAFNSANAGSVAGTNAPYIQLLACQKS